MPFKMLSSLGKDGCWTKIEKILPVVWRDNGDDDYNKDNE